MEPKKRETKGDMTPMIDCVFLLLIFFIIAAKFITPEGHLDIWQPKGSGQSNSDPVEAEELLDVRIFIRDGDTTLIKSQKIYAGKYCVFLDQDLIYAGPKAYTKWKKTDHAGYTATVKDIRAAFTLLNEKIANYAKMGAKTSTVIDCDPNVPYLFVVEAMNVCTQNELDDVKFAAQKRRLTKLHDGVIEMKPYK